MPCDVPAGAFGPRLEAAIATLSVRNRISRRDLVELLEQLFGCSLSTGTVAAILTRTAAAVDPVYQDLLAHIQSARAVNIDETGWRLQGRKRTLWGVLTPLAAVFRVAPDRHQREAKALLGEGFQGIACSDRWWAYDHLAPERRQLCWSHLVRDFTAHSEGLQAQQEFGARGLAIAGRLFEAWQQFRASGDRSQLLEQIRPLEDELRALL